MGQAHRRGRAWVTHLAEHGVYAHGRTLRATEANAVEGLELAGVRAEVTLTPVTPELEMFRAADDAREQALRAGCTPWPCAVPRGVTSSWQHGHRPGW